MEEKYELVDGNKNWCLSQLKGKGEEKLSIKDFKKLL